MVFDSESAVDEIHAFNPNARIIIMLRRPDEMLYSLHSQLLYSGEEDLEDFGAALAAESSRAEGHQMPVPISTGPPPRSVCFTRELARLLRKRYQARFEHVRIVLHDDLSATLRGPTRRCWSSWVWILDFSQTFRW